MPATIRLNQTADGDSVFTGAMKRNELYVVTDAGHADVRRGEVVIRLDNYVAAVGREWHGGVSAREGVKVRPLRPHESVVVRPTA